MTLDYDQGMLDQAEADIPALRYMERYGVEQYYRAQNLQRDLNDSWHSQNCMRVLIGALAFVIVILVAALAAKW